MVKYSNLSHSLITLRMLKASRQDLDCLTKTLSPMGSSSTRSTGVLWTCVVLLGVVAVSGRANFTTYDKELIQVALNLEYLEADYFLWGAYGYGLDVIAPNLTGGGPNPIGAQKANLNAYFTDVYQQMGLQEVGHLRCVLPN